VQKHTAPRSGKNFLGLKKPSGIFLYISGIFDAAKFALLVRLASTAPWFLAGQSALASILPSCLALFCPRFGCS